MTEDNKGTYVVRCVHWRAGVCVCMCAGVCVYLFLRINSVLNVCPVCPDQMPVG